MSLKIFHAVNAGLYFHNSESGLLIDGLHLGDGGFSVPCKDLVDLAFTHLHGDHSVPILVRRFYENNPNSDIYASNLSMSCSFVKTLADGINHLQFRDFLLTAFSTTHDGPFANQPYCSFCLQAEGQQHLICGDAILNQPPQNRYWLSALTEPKPSSSMSIS